MRKTIGGLVLVAILALIACSSSAASKCDTWEGKWCTRAVECKLYETVAACETAIGSIIDCSKVVSVGTTYDACVSDTGAQTCSEFTAGIPSSCKGVFKIQ